MSSLHIVEIHPAESPKALNTEWFVLENRGDKPFNTRNCVLSVRRKGQKRKKDLGTIDPGFVLAPGARTRVLTGNPGKKAHGKPPADDTPNYNLFLGSQVLIGPGSELMLSLRTHVLTTAVYDPSSDGGVESAE
jgi:hypothetical protein